MLEARRLPWSVTLLMSFMLGALHLVQVNCQQNFIQAQVPNFGVGIFYPARSNNAIQAEMLTCRVITDRIERNSARFSNELVTNTNGRISFSTADSRIMSSRMQTTLDDLAIRYSSGRMTILKAWSQYPDPDLAGEQMSLHYEGRTVRVRLSSSSQYANFLNLAIEARFDWVYYAASNYVRLSVIPSNCQRNVDCVFLLDRSGSVGRTNHGIALQFITSVIGFFTIGLNTSRVGMAAYSYSSSIQFDLDDFTTSSSLVNAVDNVAYTGGATNTPSALNDARTLLNPSNNRGARLNSFGIPKIAILITDGRSNRGGSLGAASQALRDSGVQVYTVGIGNIAVTELRNIASDPDDEHVFILSSYLDAGAFVDFLSVVTCDTPAIVDPGDNTTTEVTDGGIKYFQTECSAFSDKILVEIIDINGTSFLYCSSVEANPGPLTPNTVRNETTGITRRTGLILLPNQQKVVYVGIQGQGMSDAFTLIVWDQLFDPADVFINVVEGAQPGVTIYEVSRNLTTAAQGNNYMYSFIEGDGDGIFAIDSGNGRVFIPSSGSPGVNFNLRLTHNLTVQAQNTGEECQRARIRINIRVISNQINFQNLPTQQVPESATIGTFVVRVVATGGAGSIEYFLVSGNVGGAFAINQNTGRVTVNGGLDFRSRNSYTLRVRAESTGTTVNGEINLNIMILDVNEAHTFVTPCARNGQCTYDIDENQPSGAFIATIVASDPDVSTSPNGMLRYSLTPVTAPFTVGDDEGIISSSISLNRESTNSYSLVLSVSDRNSISPFTIQTNIQININDLNDNTPIFTLSPDRVELNEDAQDNSVVTQYIATDRDIGTNAQVTYSISSTHSNLPFTVDSANGLLRLTGNIDFELVQSYTITVTATDGQMSVSANTEIVIINVNDNRPVFSNLPDQMDVEENSNSGTAVFQAMATDGDLDLHGEVRYFITAGNFNDSFVIDAVSGSISVNNNIDRERITTFNLQIRAEDLGTPQRKRTHAILSITVLDVNDNGPIFRPSSYSVQLREDLLVSSDVDQVFASDADQENHINSIIVFNIISGNSENKFTIDSTSGAITIREMLDFETIPAYTLTVEARDGGNPTRSSSATVNIAVVNVNEQPPTLTGDQAVEVSELAPVTSVVARFQALDPDQMAVTFAITSGNEEGKFLIGSSSGDISLAANLDYETTTAYTLGITASDGTNNANALLSISVLDENEFAPQFTGTDQFSISEEQPGGSIVGTVNATDLDRDATITYSFVNQDQSTSNFILDSDTGAITTAGRIDREQQVQIFIPDASTVTVEVSARDNGSPSMRSVKSYTIELVDINDNSPIFTSSEYSNMLLENLEMPANRIVFETQATDMDLGSNGDVRYSFTVTNGDASLFEIDDMTGTIVTTTSLDCEVQPLYTFIITANDLGTPDQRSTEVSGSLMVIDVNDNSPVFDSIQPLTLSEMTSPITDLITVSANDADKGLNGEVVYSVINEFNVIDFLESSVIVTRFSIDQSTGILTNDNEFDFESAPQINVTVIATDRGVPQRNSTIIITINIINVDETAPFFPRSCDARISEDTPVGNEITRCMAIDQDTIAAPGQSPIIYSFSSPNQFLAIDANTGQITVNEPLNRERSSSIAVSVIATDLAGRTGNRLTRIRLNDVNDNAPAFESSTYSYQFTDDAIRQYIQNILTVSAMDPDLQENGTVVYELGGTYRSSNTLTQVEVIASDTGIQQMSSRINISVSFQSPCQLQSYSIESSTGLVSADLLCSIAISNSILPIVLGGRSTLTCGIVRNSRTTFQWLHNGTAVTNQQELSQNRLSASFVLSNIRFSDAGEYVCKATSPAGSLQTPISSAVIQVSPTFTTLPQDRSATVGSSVTFTCFAVGLPPPDIKWFIGTQQIAEGNNYTIPVVTANNMGTYTCAARNNARSISSNARLTVFDSFNAVQLELESINNPNKDGTCHHFNPELLKSTIDEVSSPLKTMVTAVNGEKLCEISPCSPSPCRNEGSCVLNNNITGGYECGCRLGYTGVNCTMDVDECEQDPCGGDGECSNVVGSFDCNCNEGKSGRFCQSNDECSAPDLCAADEECVETSSASGYTCIILDETSSLVVGGLLADIGRLSDLTQAFIERGLALSNGAIKRRRRRQASTFMLITICEPRFITVGDDKILVWLCPSGEVQPSVDAHQGLCDFLFGSYMQVLTCKLPNGEELTPPTSPPLPEINIKVTIVLVDSSNSPIEALDSLKTLQSSEVQESLVKNGLTVGSISPQESEPRPQSRTSDSSSIVGGVVGTLLAIALLSLVTVAVVIVVKRRQDSHKRKQEKKKKMALQMVVMEEGSNGNTTTIENNTAHDDSLPPKRPPKTAEVKDDCSVQDDIYQNVTTGLGTSMGSVTKLIDDDGDDYDSLPTATENDNDYDTLPSKKVL